MDKPTTITRRALLRAAPAATVTMAMPAIAAGAEPDQHPWEKARALARELSDLLPQCDGMVAVIQPVDADKWPVAFLDHQLFSETMFAAPDLAVLARRFAHLAQRMDPTIIGVGIGTDETLTKLSFEQRVNGVFLSRRGPTARSQRVAKPKPSRVELAINAHEKAWQAFNASCPLADDADPRFGGPAAVARSKRLGRSEARKLMALLRLPLLSSKDNAVRARYVLHAYQQGRFSMDAKHVVTLLTAMGAGL